MILLNIRKFSDSKPSFIGVRAWNSTFPRLSGQFCCDKHHTVNNILEEDRTPCQNHEDRLSAVNLAGPAEMNRMELCFCFRQPNPLSPGMDSMQPHCGR